MVIKKITFKYPLIKYSKTKNSNLTIVPHIGEIQLEEKFME